MCSVLLYAYHRYYKTDAWDRRFLCFMGAFGLYLTHIVLTDFANIFLRLTMWWCDIYRLKKIRQDISIGPNILRHRRMMDLSQEQLAALMRQRGCDTTRSSLSRIELGSYNIKVSELIAICDILNVDFNELICPQNSMKYQP